MHPMSGAQAGSLVSSAAQQRVMPTPPTNISAIARELEKSKQIGAVMHEMIDRLEQKVLPIRMATPPQADSSGTEPQLPTDLARTLQAVNATNGMALLRLQSIVETIDL